VLQARLPGPPGFGTVPLTALGDSAHAATCLYCHLRYKGAATGPASSLCAPRLTPLNGRIYPRAPPEAAKSHGHPRPVGEGMPTPPAA